MQYSILRVASPYNDYVQYLEQQHPEIKDMSYQDHYQRIVDNYFGCDGYYLNRELAAMGMETHDIIYIDSLQQKWRPETAGLGMFEILLEQVKTYKPDVLFVSNMFSTEQLRAMKEIVPKAKIVCFMFAAVNDRLKENCRYYDQLYTGSERYVKILSRYHGNVRYLQHAVCGEILDKIDTSHPRENKASFAGHFFLPYHGKRLLCAANFVKNGVPIDFAADIMPSYRIRDLKSLVKYTLKPPHLTEYQKELREADRIVSPYLKPAVFGLEYYQFLWDHTVSLNVQADQDWETGDSGSDRMYEATLMGSCLLTNQADENRNLYEPDREIMEFESPEDCGERARWLIDHPTEAAAIAEAGQKRTLRQYTYRNRAEMLNDYLQELLR